jgi:hypothetical protein
MTVTWILVLTLIRYQSAAVEAIPGFANEAACIAAAQAWLKRNPGPHNVICVKSA